MLTLTSEYREDSMMRPVSSPSWRRHQLSRRPARTVILLVLALLAGLISVAAAGSASAATTFTSTVVNQGNGNCATVPGGAGTSALQLTQSACGSGAGQSFTFTPVGDA